MSSQISLKVGNVTATLPIGANVTDQQVAQALTRYAAGLGIPVNGSAQENLTAILAHIVDSIRRRAKAQQVADATTAAQAAIIAQAESDNAL